MITWIQKYFQHHFRAMFAVLLGLIIISFVFITNTSGGFGRADRQMVDREFFGYNLSLQSDQQKLFGDAGLSIRLRYGAFAQLQPEQLQNYAFQRAATLHLAGQWRMPEATDDEIKKQIETLRLFAGQDGKFDAKAYATYRDDLKTNPRGTTQGDVRRVISDDVRAEKVQALLAGPGYVLPGEIKTRLSLLDTSWTLSTASVDYRFFKPEIKPAEAELTQFFEQSGGRYDISPRVVVSYVDFPALDLIASVNVTEVEVRAFYDGNPARFPKPAEIPKSLLPSPLVTPPADPAADFAAVRAQVESTLRLERAQKLATAAASDFSVALYEAKATTPPAIEAFLAARKLTAKPVPPFSREAAPLELSGSPELAAAAFRLNQDRLASDAIATPNGAIILFWKETQPTRKPLFLEVRDKVAADYTENERRKRFVELGKSVKAQLETRLKAGDTFEAAAAAAVASTGLNIEAKTLAPFTPRTRPQDIDRNILGALERLEKGQVSDMAIGADKGLFVYAAEKKIPDITDANPQFADTRKEIAGYNGGIVASTFLNEMVEKELKRSEPKGQ